MIIVLKPRTSQQEADEILSKIEKMGLKPLYMPGVERTVIGALGDERMLGRLHLESHPAVERVDPILAPYKAVSREMHPEDSTIQVGNLTTPANYFHALRRQLQRDFRKPLVLMTPKSLLRHKRAVSSLEEMAAGSTFHRLLWDDAQSLPDQKIKLVPDEKIRRVVLTSGKVYYDLYEEREKRGIDDIYLLRVEQLYPFPAKALITELSRFRQADIVWCQEEPKNMGAWFFVEPYLQWVLDNIEAERRRPRYVGRAASAATATGLMSKHLEQLAAFLDEALAE